MSRFAEYLTEVAIAIQRKEPIDLEALDRAVLGLQDHVNRVWDRLEAQEEWGLENLDQGWRETLSLYQEALDLAVLGAVEPGPQVAERLLFTLREAGDQALDVRQQVELVNGLITEEMTAQDWGN